MYKKLFLALILLVLVNSVNASEEADWLVSQGDDGDWGGVRKTAFSIMALDKETGYNDLVVSGSEYLTLQLENCMASNTCNVEDTSIALLALNEIGGNSEIVDDISSWLLDSRNNIFTGELPNSNNEWFVQVVSDVGGSCLLTNTETGNSVNVPVDVSSGYVPWFNVDANILTATTENLNVDCTGLGDGLTLSLINKKPISGIENYFINQEVRNSDNISVSFGIPCWGQSYRGGNCNKETSGYVLYALNEVGKSGDPSWLAQQNNLGLLETAFLYKVTNDGKYLTSLINEKNPQGFWGSADLFATSLIFSLLKPDSIIDGVDGWVISRRHGDACWQIPLCSVEQTALVLYSGSFQQIIEEEVDESCPDLDEDLICDDDDNDIDGDGLLNDIDPFPRNPDANGNGILDGDEDLDGDGFLNKEDNDIDGDGVRNDLDRDPFDETIGRPDDDDDGDTNVGTICATFEGCEGIRDAIGQCIDIEGDGCPVSDTRDCNVGAYCVTVDNCSGEYSSGCRCIADADCDVGGGSTGGGTTGDVSGNEDDGSGVVLWSLLVLLLLIALGGGGFLAYKKGLLKFKFGKKKPEAKYTPKLLPKKPEKYVPRVAGRAAKKIPKVAKSIEKELDQSMKDLEKLLGKD